MDTDTRHAFRTRSAHRTSEGIVRYEACLCGRWRIRLDAGGELAPGGGAVVALSRRVGARAAAYDRAP